MTEQANRTNLLLRNDTIFGVCEALGQDFGINPTWLRVAFCLPVFWNAGVVVAVYCGLGVIVAATRFAFPDRYADPQPALKAVEGSAAVKAEEKQDERELIAA